MSELVQVRHPDLAAHGGAVSAIGDRIDAVARAGRAARVGPDDFGPLCAMVPAALQTVQDVLVNGIDSAADALQDTATRLRGTAVEYESADRRRAAAFQGIR